MSGRLAALGRVVRRPRLWRRVIGSSELLGGALGLTVLTIGVASGGAGTLAWRPAAALAFYTLSGVAGWRLLRARRGGVALSLLVQGVQVVWLWLPMLVVRMAAGLALIGTYTSRDGGDVIVGATTTFELRVPAADERVGLGLNLFALAVVAVLTVVRRTEGASPRAEPAVASDEPAVPAV